LRKVFALVQEFVLLARVWCSRVCVTSTCMMFKSLCH